MKQSKLRIVGTRELYRFSRVFLFLGMLMLFSLAFGVENEKSVAYGGLLFLGALVGLIVWYFKTRGSQKEKHQRQLAAEVIEELPAEPIDSLYLAYAVRRKKELRLKALLYCTFAAVTLLWSLFLYALGKQPLAILVAIWFCVPALLLIGLGFLIASFLLSAKSNVSRWRSVRPQRILEEHACKPYRQKEYAERLTRPDHREEGYIPFQFSENVEAISAPPASADTGAGTNRRRRLDGSSLAAFLFFTLLPCMLFLFTLFACIGMGEMHFLLALFGLLAVFGIFLWLYLRKANRTTAHQRGASLSEETIATIRETGRVTADTLLSVERSIQDSIAMELCFDKAGTVKVQATQSYQHDLFAAQGKGARLYEQNGSIALVLLTGPKQNVSAYMPQNALSEKRESTAEKPADQRSLETPQKTPQVEESSEREEPITARFYSDEEIVSLACARLRHMKPEKRFALEKEIIELLDINALASQKGYTHLSKDETALFHRMISRQLQRTKSMDYELIGVEDVLKKKFGLTRQQIYEMKRSPYKTRIWIPLLITVGIVVGGNLLLGLIARETGADLAWAHILLSTISGSLSLSLAGMLLNQLSHHRSFKKLKKKYMDPAFWDRLVEVEAYRQLHDQLKEARNPRD